MKRLLLAVCLVTLVGCAARNSAGSASFVMNKTSQSGASQAGGKSYAQTSATLGDTGLLRCQGDESSVQLQLELKGSPAAGSEVPVQSGNVTVEGQSYSLGSGKAVIQNVQDGLARGNFNVRVKDQNPPWEVVGSFDANLGK